jgi:hypothetical protein
VHPLWQICVVPTRCAGANELLPLTDDEVVARVKSHLEINKSMLPFSGGVTGFEVCLPQLEYRSCCAWLNGYSGSSDWLQ